VVAESRGVSRSNHLFCPKLCWRREKCGMDKSFGFWASLRRNRLCIMSHPLATPVGVSFPRYDMRIEMNHTFLCDRLGITLSSKALFGLSRLGRSSSRLMIMRFMGNAMHGPPLALVLDIYEDWLPQGRKHIYDLACILEDPQRHLVTITSTAFLQWLYLFRHRPPRTPTAKSLSLISYIWCHTSTLSRLCYPQRPFERPEARKGENQVRTVVR
jgi:hypothetical protein